MRYSIADPPDQRRAIGGIDRGEALFERDVVAAIDPQDRPRLFRPASPAARQVPVPRADPRAFGGDANAFLGIAERLLGELAIGDVVDRAERADHPSVAIAQADPARIYPAHIAVGADHAVFDRELAVGGQGVVGLAKDRCQIIAVDQQGILVDRNHVVGGDADDPPGFFGPGGAAVDQIPFPDPGTRAFGRHPQPLLGLAQQAFTIARFGQVEGDTDKAVVDFCGIERRLRDRAQPAPRSVGPTIACLERERLQRSLPGDRFGDNPVVIVGVEDRPPVESQRLVVSDAQKFDVGAVDEAPHPIEPGKPHRHRRGIGDQPEFIGCGDVRYG
jgi:hypothetical protein